MNRKAFVILAVVALLLAGLAMLAQRGGDTASIAGDSAGELLVPGLAEQVDTIAGSEISGAGAARRERL